MNRNCPRRRGNNEGGIYQRHSDGRWCASVSLEGGKRRVFYGKTREEVAGKLTRALSDVQKGLSLPLHRLTVGAFLEQWLADVVWQRNRPSTAQNYEGYSRKYIIPALGKHQLAKLTPHQVQRFLNDTHARGLAPRTVPYIRAVLRRALNQALRWELVSRNAATLADPPTGRSPEMSPLTTEHARVLLATAHGHRYEHPYAFPLGTGQRIGEAFALRWSDVVLEHEVITVRHALERSAAAAPGAWRFPNQKAASAWSRSSAPPPKLSGLSAPEPSSSASPPAPTGKTSISSSPPLSAHQTIKPTSTTSSRSSCTRRVSPPSTASTISATAPPPTSWPPASPIAW